MSNIMGTICSLFSRLLCDLTLLVIHLTLKCSLPLTSVPSAPSVGTSLPGDLPWSTHFLWPAVPMALHALQEGIFHGFNFHLFFSNTQCIFIIQTLFLDSSLRTLSTRSHHLDVSHFKFSTNANQIPLNNKLNDTDNRSYTLNT